MNTKLADDILACFNPNELFINEKGEKFQAITISDLMQKLRGKGWRLPAQGWFEGDVQSAGFKVIQPGNSVRRDDWRGRRLAPTTTLVTL
jgi:hypothetical protein